MNAKTCVIIIFLSILVECLYAQFERKEASPHQFEFDGQASVYTSFSPDNDLDFFIGGRYLPEVNYGYTFKNESMLDFEASANLYSSVLSHPFDTSKIDGDIKPYRLWGRYTGAQYEIRVGLQKLDFGTAMMLRPLQWFDEIDPRDP